MIGHHHDGPGDGHPDSRADDQPDPGQPRRGRFTLDEVTDLSRAVGHDLVRPCDIRGILHSHSRYGDGAHPLDSMVDTAREIGLEYLGISDHFISAAHPEGLDLPAARVQRQEIEQLRVRHEGFDILQGVELDAEPDGSLPLDDATLLLFDYVIVSFPPVDGQCPADFTERVIRVASHPLVTILGRPVGDCILSCRDEKLEMARVLAAAAAGRTAVEVNANPETRELDWSCCLKAQEMGVYMAISPDAHRAARLVDFRHGAERAREAGLCCASLLNTMTSPQLRRYLSEGILPD